MKALLSLCALVVTTSCHTLETRQVSSVPTPAVRVGTRTRMWEVHCEDEVVGLVILFQEHGSARDSVYIVRNPWHQDLGLIDGLGRAYRYLPHEEEPAWVGSGTIALGAERILGTQHDCALVELPSSASESGPGSGTAIEARQESGAKAPASAPSESIHDSSDAPRSDVGLPQSW